MKRFFQRSWNGWGNAGNSNVILRALGYGDIPAKDAGEEALELRFQTEYEHTEGFNITALVANKLAGIICSEAVIEVRAAGHDGRVDGKAIRGIDEAGNENGDAFTEFGNRAVTGGEKEAFIEEMNAALEKVLRRLQAVCARVLGTGGIVLKPYVRTGRIYTDILPQNRFYALEVIGDVITKALFLADSFQKNGREYLRIEVHTLGDNGSYTIENRALCNCREVSLAETGRWAEIEPVIYMAGVRRPLFAFLRAPVDGRRDFRNIYGVPVTYGCEKTIEEIKDLFDQMQREFELKKAFIGTDVKLFDEDDELVKSGLYKRFSDSGFGIGDKAFWEVFSPDIRQESYIHAIEFKLAQLEKSIGVNKGILTDLDTADATATAIRRSTFDTFNLADAMRREIEEACEDLVYAYEVLMYAFGLTQGGSVGTWELNFDWSYSLIEETAETFEQLMAGYEAGLVTAEEMRMFLFERKEGGKGEERKEKRERRREKRRGEGWR